MLVTIVLPIPPCPIPHMVSRGIFVMLGIIVRMVPLLQHHVQQEDSVIAQETRLCQTVTIVQQVYYIQLLHDRIQYIYILQSVKLSITFILTGKKCVASNTVLELSDFETFWESCVIYKKNK